MNPYGNLREASNDPLKVLNPTPLKEPCKRSLKGTLHKDLKVYMAPSGNPCLTGPTQKALILGNRLSLKKLKV